MNEIITILIFPLIVAFAGWLRNALQDKVIDWPEWQKLIETILVIAVPIAMLHYGLGADATITGSIVSIIVLTISQIRNSLVNKK